MLKRLPRVSDASYDGQRAIKGIRLDDELDECKRLVKGKGIDREYQHFLRLILRKAGVNISPQETEDYDGVDDPQNMANHMAESEESTRMDKRHLYQMPDRRNKCKKVVKEKDKDSDQHHLRFGLGKAKTNESHKRKRGNVRVDEDGWANIITEVRSDNGRLHQKPSQKTGLGKAKTNESHIRKRGNVRVDEDAEANIKTKVRSDNGRLHQKPSQKTGLGKAKTNESHKRKRGNVRVDEDGGANIKTEVRSDNGRLHQKPSQKTGLGKAKANESHKRKRGNVRVGEDGGANIKTEVRPDNGRLHQKPSQKTAFENYSVKSEPDDGVKTRLHTKEVNNKIRSFKTAFGKDVVNGPIKLTKVGQGGRGFPHQQAAFGNCSVKKGPEGVKTRLCTKEIQSKFRSVKTSVTCKKDFMMTKKGNVEISSEVEILDDVAICKGKPSPFEPSITYNEFQERGRPSVLDDYRKDLLEVLNKPYDREEYRQHKEAIRIGSYTTHYPDLGKKLAVHRYKQKKCLAILRGFFFWLENVPREGSFKPWKDRECLAVVPASP